MGKGGVTSDKDLSLSETILKLYRGLIRTSELEDFPERIREPIRELIPFDLLCVFLTGNHDSAPALINRNNVCMSWERIYPGISVEDQRSSILYKGQPGDVFLSQDMKGPGCEGDEHVLGLIRQESGMRFSMHLVISVPMGFRLHLSLFRRRKSFDKSDAETLRLFAPALVTSGNALLASWLSGSEDLLLSISGENSSYHYMLLDHKLKVIGMPEHTKDFLKTNFTGPATHGLPTVLREWLNNLMLGHSKEDHEVVRSMVLTTDSCLTECKVYMLENSSGNNMTLVVLCHLKEAGDFRPLLSMGFSQRELNILENLYEGKTNVQIGDHLKIREVTVRKHLLNIGRKLNAFSRSEILAKVIKACIEVPSMHHPINDPQLSFLDNQVQTDSTQMDLQLELVINLHKSLSRVMSFDDVPEVLKQVLSEHKYFDWAAIYCVNASDDIEKIAFNPWLRCNWEKLYPAIRKSMTWLPIVRQGRLGQVFLSHDLIDPDNEDHLHMKIIMEESTGAHFSMHMPVARTHGHRVYLGFYRNDPDMPFKEEDKTLMDEISPIILSWAQSLVLLWENAINQLGCGSLLEKEKVRAVLLDRHLCDVMWTKDALSLLETQVGPSWRDVLLPSIKDWVGQNHLMQNRSSGKTYPEHLALDGYGLVCWAYPLDEYVLVNFKRHDTDPFHMLREFGLTGRETQVLAYLPLGYTNWQIASNLGISEIAVKKHLEHIGRKLNVKGRVSILRQAEVLRRSVKE